MAGLGWQELVIVLVIIMIIFGAGKLPEVARSLGQGVKEFKTEAGAPITDGVANAKATVNEAGETVADTAAATKARLDEV
jgi:sec-independent protein translocase protein TatA